MIVVDASVAVKWFVPEQDSEKAEQLVFSRRKLLAPKIISIEVAAAIIRLARIKSISPAMATTLLQDWQRALSDETVTLEPTQYDFQNGTQLSLDLEHPLQDCLYLATADRLEVLLLTADNKFFKKATAAGHDVKLLADQWHPTSIFVPT